MTFSDQQLSAFLDGELGDVEMQALRDALADDEALADRLAELALVDALVRESAAIMDQQPLPLALSALLAADDSSGGRVVTLPSRPRLRQVFSPQMAIAASIALVAAIGLGQLGLVDDRPSWQQVAHVLETAPSGSSRPLGQGVEVVSRLTYLDTAGNYCRQFQVRDGTGLEESIACRGDGGWRLQIRVSLPPVTGEGEYRAASGGSALDAVLDRSLKEGPFDRERELLVIDGHWGRGEGLP